MNQKPLKLLCVLAHPDDESLGMGGTIARYTSEGVETYLITATRGERGWFGDEKDNPHETHHKGLWGHRKMTVQSARSMAAGLLKRTCSMGFDKRRLQYGK